MQRSGSKRSGHAYNHTREFEMNKKQVFTLAAMASSALYLQSAMAQTTVQVYGRLNVDLESIKYSNPTGGVSGDMNRLSSNSSRLGFRGTEDFGGNLKAIFQIESAVSPDSGTGTLAGRDTFVGLQGDWGKVRLGFIEDAVKGFGEFTDRFKGTGIQDDGTISALGGGTAGFSRRQVNSISYNTPLFAGFEGHIQYGIEDEQPVNAKTSLTAALHYGNGPLKLGVAFGDHHNFTIGRTDKAYRLGAKYDFGAFDVAGGMTRLDYEVAGGNIVHNYYTVSTGIKLAGGVLNLKYGMSPNNSGSAADGSVSAAGSDGARLFKGPNSGAKLYTVGYEYNLSKRTQLYTYYTRISNDANANYRFGTNGVNIAQAGPGASPSGFVLGMSHDF
jgi:predicted porin